MENFRSWLELWDAAVSIPLRMGILNLTPDSFSDGGRFLDPEAALAQASFLQEKGADILDIGAESTRPGYIPVSTDEQIARLTPVLERIIPALHIPFSVDTTQPEVARVALERGAGLLNDISALQHPDMLALALKYQIPVVLMHGVSHLLAPEDHHPVETICQWLLKRAEVCAASGIRKNHIILDPGIGFGTTLEQDVAILENMNEVTALPYPILVGFSHKRVTRFLYPDLSREEATVQLGKKISSSGVAILRLHDWP